MSNTHMLIVAAANLVATPAVKGKANVTDADRSDLIWEMPMVSQIQNMRWSKR